MIATHRIVLKGKRTEHGGGSLDCDQHAGGAVNDSLDCHNASSDRQQLLFTPPTSYAHLRLGVHTGYVIIEKASEFPSKGIRRYLAHRLHNVQKWHRYRTTYQVPLVPGGTWYSLCLVTLASIRRHHKCLYCSHLKDYVANIPNFYVRVGLLEKIPFFYELHRREHTLGFCN